MRLQKTDEELDKEIAENREYLEWNNAYIKCLKKGIVSFDKPIWEGKSIECNIEDDLYFIYFKKDPIIVLSGFVFGKIPFFILM